MVMVATWVLLIFHAGGLATPPTEVYFHTPAACEEARVVLERMRQVRQAVCLPLDDQELR